MIDNISTNEKYTSTSVYGTTIGYEYTTNDWDLYIGKMFEKLGVGNLS